MARPQSKHPTELELEILKILWSESPLTGREVRDRLAARSRDVAYTSVMTIMGIMEEKGYVRRKKQAGSFVYSARVTEKTTTRRMLQDLVQRAYDGSVMAAMVNLLEAGDMGADELRQLRQLLNQKSEEPPQ
jgi:predicted transcriptional regulator